MRLLGDLRITAGQIDAPDDEAHTFALRLIDRAATDATWRVYACANDDCDCDCRRYVP